MAKPSMIEALLAGKHEEPESEYEAVDEKEAIGAEILDAIKNSDGKALAEAICNLMDIYRSDAE